MNGDLDDIGWVMWSGTIGLDSTIQSRVEAALAAACSRLSFVPHVLADAEAGGTNLVELGRSLRDAGLDAIMDPIAGWYGGAPLPGRFGEVSLDDILRMGEDLQVVTLNVMGPFVEGEATFDQLVERFASLCDRVADLGAQVTIEFMPMTTIGDLDSAWELVNAANRPNGGVSFDTWHFYRGTPDLSALERVPGDRIFTVQVADATAEPHVDPVEDTLNRELPGDGDFDLVTVLAALDRIGALRWVGAEVISPVTAAMPPAEAAGLATSRVRDLIAGIRERA